MFDGAGFFIPEQSAGGTDGGTGCLVALLTEQGSIVLTGFIHAYNSDIYARLAWLTLLTAVTESTGQLAGFTGDTEIRFYMITKFH
jgi:N-acetylglucosamine kinase-like BadF-type ATPase